MKLIIPGIPVPQARLRHYAFKGLIKTYDPNHKHKQSIKSSLQMLSDKKTLLELHHPRISFLFHMPIPKSLSKKELVLHNTGFLKHDKKPDVDNLVKLYLDCLDGIFLHGDQKVSLGSCIKVYHPEPKTVIWINEMTNQLTAEEMDYLCSAEEHDTQYPCEIAAHCG